MSMMRCESCERLVDTDFEVGEYFEVPEVWLCDKCSCDERRLAEFGITLKDDGSYGDGPDQVEEAILADRHRRVEELAAQTAYGRADEEELFQQNMGQQTERR